MVAMRSAQLGWSPYAWVAIWYRRYLRNILIVDANPPLTRRRPTYDRSCGCGCGYTIHDSTSPLVIKRGKLMVSGGKIWPKHCFRAWLSKHGTPQVASCARTTTRPEHPSPLAALTAWMLWPMSLLPHLSFLAILYQYSTSHLYLECQRLQPHRSLEVIGSFRAYRRSTCLPPVWDIQQTIWRQCG
jgi:hypothetical protein